MDDKIFDNIQDEILSTIIPQTMNSTAKQQPNFTTESPILYKNNVCTNIRL